jgi:hypothetical protein
MSVCRSRGRPRLGGGSGNQYLEDPGCSSSAISEGWAGGNARAESAATARITRFSTAVHTSTGEMTRMGVSRSGLLLSSAVVMRSETVVAGPVVEQDCALRDEPPGRTNRV